MKYRIEKTKRAVQAIGPGGSDAEGVTTITIVWNDAENIGVEYETPYFASAIVSDPERGASPFLTDEGRHHAREVAKAIEKYVTDNKIFD